MASHERDCEHCGEAFVAGRTDARHCSASCRALASRARTSASRPPPAMVSLSLSRAQVQLLREVLATAYGDVADDDDTRLEALTELTIAVEEVL